jgi:hypothetical protein
MNPFQPDESNRQHPFVAPEGYFDDLPARIQQRVDVDSATAQKPALGLFPRWAYAVISIFAVAAVSAWLLTRPTASTTTQASVSSAEQLLAEVPTETLVDYLLLAEVDVISAGALSEVEKTELLKQFDASDLTNELPFDDTNDEDN